MPRLEVKHVEKAWGQEVWVDNSDLYCGKILVIKPGWQCSLHQHPIKTESFLILEGRVILEVEIDGQLSEVTLELGEAWRLEPGTLHRFRSADGNYAMVAEFSTKHSDEDVVRVEDSKEI